MQGKIVEKRKKEERTYSCSCGVCGFKTLIKLRKHLKSSKLFLLENNWYFDYKVDIWKCPKCKPSELLFKKVEFIKEVIKASGRSRTTVYSAVKKGHNSGKIKSVRYGSVMVYNMKDVEVACQILSEVIHQKNKIKKLQDKRQPDCRFYNKCLSNAAYSNNFINCRNCNRYTKDPDYLYPFREIESRQEHDVEVNHIRR